MKQMPGRPERRIWRDTRADADDEIAFHLEMRERDFRERGMSDEEARAEARRRFAALDGPGIPRAAARRLSACSPRALSPVRCATAGAR